MSQLPIFLYGRLMALIMVAVLSLNRPRSTRVIPCISRDFRGDTAGASPASGPFKRAPSAVNFTGMGMDIVKILVGLLASKTPIIGYLVLDGRGGGAWAA